MKNYHKIMEYFWLAIAIITAVNAGLMLYKGADFSSENAIPLFFPVVALVLYASRRHFNRKMKKREQEENQNQ